jgi:hypothetical protein
VRGDVTRRAGATRESPTASIGIGDIMPGQGCSVPGAAALVSARTTTGAVLVIAGLISTGYHNTDATDPKAPHRRRIPRFVAEESCW